MENSITVIIPAKNEAGKIGKVIEGISAMSKDYHIIVIDDDSSDNTMEIARSFGCEAYRLDRNMGKGYACRFGVKKARTECIVFFDADGQFYPEEIPALVKKLDGYDFVIGARSGKDIPFQRRVSNSFARGLVNSITRFDNSDVLCGFRAARRSSFRKLGLEKDRYEFESEMLIKAKRKGMSMTEVPVKVRYFDYPGMPLSQSLKLALYIVKEWFRWRHE